MSRYLRNPLDGEQRASNIELFYDLVFVFAVTQVSHLLLHDLTWRGAGKALLVLLVVWCAWNYMTWVTNALDLDRVPVRLLVLAIMLASLVMAVAVPGVFSSRGLIFACAYVAIQLGRQGFLTFVAAGRGSLEREASLHIFVWFCFSAPLWIAGGLADGPMRVAFWVLALLIDYSAPLVFYRIPGRPRLGPEAWTVETAHFAERFQLFVIIALGESIVLTGATTSGLPLDPARMAGFVLAFVIASAMWWLYFSYVATIAQRRLERAAVSTTLARDGYTYLHVVLVAGIIVGAVGNELVIVHPTDVLPTPEVIAVVAGPTLYLLGHALFRLRMAGTLSSKRAVGALLCIAVGAVGLWAPALVMAACLAAILVCLIVIEHAAGVRRLRRGEASPLERLDPRTESHEP